MDNETKAIIRTLELGNESKAQELSIAYQRIVNLEQQVADLTGSDLAYDANESQIDFIKRIAASSSKFAKEAQDIIDVIDNPPVPTPDLNA
jgi:hypothetical protein